MYWLAERIPAPARAPAASAWLRLGKCSVHSWVPSKIPSRRCASWKCPKYAGFMQVSLPRKPPDSSFTLLVTG